MAAAEQLRHLARLRRVRDRITRECAMSLDVQALASTVGLSAGQLSCDFLAAYGESIDSHLVARRMACAGPVPASGPPGQVPPLGRNREAAVTVGT